VSIEREILAALTATSGPQTTAEIHARCPSAENLRDVSRVLYYLRQEGLIAFGPDRQVDKAKPKKTYWITRLGTEHYLTEGKMESIDSVAVSQMASAEEDNGEACLDSAAASHNGDELAHAWTHTPAGVDHLAQDDREKSLRNLYRSEPEPDQLDAPSLSAFVGGPLSSDHPIDPEEVARIDAALRDDRDWDDPIGSDMLGVEDAAGSDIEAHASIIETEVSHILLALFDAPLTQSTRTVLKASLLAIQNSADDLASRWV
jgi:hypothetical protein